MVGVYERWILPRLLDLSMRNRLLDHYRQRTIESRAVRGYPINGTQRSGSDARDKFHAQGRAGQARRPR